MNVNYLYILILQQSWFVSSELKGNLCQTLLKVEVKEESHFGDSNHGDVCRKAHNNGFFCPHGCSASSNQPYCLEQGDELLPCRLLSSSTPSHEGTHKITANITMFRG